MKTQGFLAKRDLVYKETIDAGKEKLGRDAALRLARQASTVIAARGKKVLTFDMKKNPPADEELLAAILGPTGNLRAPALLRGATLLIGFDEATYRKFFD